MAIRVACPDCSAEYRLKDALAGRRFKCRGCGAAVRVPLQTPAADSPPATEASPTRSPAAMARVRVKRPSADQSPPPIAIEARAEPRRARAEIPLAVWFVTGMTVLVLLVGWAVHARRQELARRQQSTAAAPAASAARPQNPARFAPQRPEAPASVRPVAGAAWEDIYPFVEKAIVKIDAYDRFNNRTALGSGFVIDARGLVATNYHVASAAFAKADVLFNDGTRYGVEGYYALAPEWDLAILKINGAPPGVQVLPLDDAVEPRKASTIYAIGHPHDHVFVPTHGIVARCLATEELPLDSQAFLRATLGETGSHRWIEHDARISPGNSGGPLVNQAGAVVGVNTWVNRETQLGYAIHTSHLAALRERPLAKVEPLAAHYHDPDRLAFARGEMFDISADEIDALVERCFQMAWTPGSADDYTAMQRLATAVTFAKHLEQNPALRPQKDDLERDALVERANAALDRLARFAWRTDPHIEAMNPLAAAALAEPFAGVMAFGQVERLFEGTSGQRGLLITLAGRDEKIFVPLSAEVTPLDDGSPCLVLGIHFPAVLPFGENPLQPQRAHILMSLVVLSVRPS